MIKPEDVFQIGRIGKPHGVKGEVSFHFTDDIFDRTDSDYLILEIDGILVPFFMDEYRFRSDETALISFCDIDSQEKARELTGCPVFFLRSEVPADDDEELTWAQIIGFSILNDATDEVVGTLESVDDSTINTLFEVRTPEGQNVLLPANEDLITDVNTSDRTISLIIPDGLLEI